MGVSVAAHKAQHHTLKAAEYAKKGYAFGYVKPAVYAAAPVQSVASYVAPATYTHATYGMPVYNTYAGVHHLGKREAEADSQYLYSNGVFNTGVYANGYNGYAMPKVYSNVASPVYTGYNGVYNGVSTESTTPMLESTILASVMLKLTLNLSTTLMLDTHTPLDTLVTPDTLV